MVHNTILCLSIALLIIALPFAESKAYCTYHNYNSWDSLTTVACSDGANGVMTKLGYSDLSRMFPYVTAFSGATWNSPNCGRCVQVSSGGRSVFLTVIDQCGPAPGGFDAHFDISPPAFRELFGDAGVNAGVQSADWQFVDEGRCLGNRGNSGNTPSNNPPPPVAQPPPPPSNKGHSNVRCGWNWGDANGKCGTPCTNDGPCAGQRCYADLDIGPCNRATEDDTTSFDSSDDFTIDAAVADTASVETDEGNFVDDVSMNTETETVDAAIADVAEEDNYVDNYVDSAMVDAAVADGSFDEIDSNFVANDNYVDAAVAGEGFSADTTQQQQTQTASAGMQGWMVAIIVVFTITTVLLLVVIVLAISVLRKH